MGTEQQSNRSPINSRMKKPVIMLVVGVLILAAMGAGIAWYWYANTQEEAQITEEEKRIEMRSTFGGWVENIDEETIEVYNYRVDKQREFYITDDTVAISDRRGTYGDISDIQVDMDVNIRYYDETKEAVEIWF